MMGRSIKEYTEFFDRGYWGTGTRKAEPSYDLFAAGMILIDAAVGKRFEKKEQPHRQLIRVIKEHPKLFRYQDVLLKAINGQYGSAKEMRREFLVKLNETETSYSVSRINKHNGRKRRQNAFPGKKTEGWMGRMDGSPYDRFFNSYHLYPLCHGVYYVVCSNRGFTGFIYRAGSRFEKPAFLN
ncbi:hypothetical protein QS257_00610 [Terrilactibacillus sp. S3-3]|nr:hypothetical protein QS257_00610 [Terrilactibacillus sp. S3-3]